MTIVFATLLGTLSILCFNAILALAFTGLGLTLRRAFGLAQATLDDCFTAFWMGFGLIIVFLMLWNFALPVGGGAPLAIVLVTGIAGMLAARRWITPGLRESAPPLWSVITAVVFSLWVSNLSLGQMTAWDSSLYHMQGVKWASNYPVVPGVANVFGPIGFNNASLLYDAMLDAGPWSGRAWHVSNGVLVSVFLAQLIISASRILSRRTPVSPIHVFSLLLLPVAVNSAFDGVPNFMTVVPSSLVLMITTALGYRVLVDTHRPAREKAHDLFCMTFLAATAVSIKTSAAVFAAIVLAVCCYEVIRLGRAVDRARTLGWMFAAVIVIGVAWVTRGVIMSGYPLFPSPVLGLPVDWRVPVEHARAEYDFVVHSARATADNFAFVSGKAEGLAVWLPRWGLVAFDNLYELVAPVGLAALMAFFLLLSKRRATAAERAAMRSGWWLLTPLLITLAAWFLIAPMPSYGAPFFWSVAALLGAQAFRLLPRSDAFTRKMLVAGCLLGVTPWLVNPIWSSFLETRRTTGLLTAVLNANILSANIKTPDPGRWYQIHTPPQLSAYTTNTGVTLNVPIGHLGRCWDAPLPCTPNPAPNLRLRVPGRMEMGFTVDGHWQMRDWPEPWRPKLLPAMREGWRRSDTAASAR